MAAEATLTRPQALSLYGFSDFGFNKFYTSDKSQLNALFPSKAGTFVLGNANVFFDAEPYEGWRNLIEVRFTNLPNGYEQSLGSSFGTTYTRNNTTIGDFTSPSIRGSVTLGLDHHRASADGVRRLRRPAHHGRLLLHAVGHLERRPRHPDAHLAPDAVVHGGRLPAEPTARRAGVRQRLHTALGVRVPRLRRQQSHAVTGGLQRRESPSAGGSSRARRAPPSKRSSASSGYYGHGLRHHEGHRRGQSVPGANDGDRRLPGVDGRRGRIARRRAHSAFDSKASSSASTTSPGRTRRNDSADGTYYTDGYAILAYRLPFWGLEPYVYGEAIHWKSDLGDTALIPSVGLNIHFNPAVQLKAQYGRAMFMDLSSHAGPHAERQRRQQLGRAPRGVVLMDRRTCAPARHASLGVAGCSRTARAGSTIAVVVNPKNPIRTLGAGELEAIFTTRKLDWPDGSRVVPFNYPARHPLRTAFDARALHLDADDAARYWIDRRVRGGHPPPRQVSDVATMLTGHRLARVGHRLPATSKRSTPP